MSRSNNLVMVAGRVIQFKSRYTDSGKPRAFYQIELEPKAQDGDVTFRPFVKSVGNQAKKDIDNIHIGDVITVSGRIQTRMEKKKIYLKVNEHQEKENENDPLDDTKLRVIDIDDEYDSFSDDDKIFEVVVERQITEIFAEDVDYISDKLFKMNPVEQARMINKNSLAGLIELYKENNMTLDELITNLKNSK